ncbi:hypothetical protein PIB30_043984 [Stylosanthes scabra]|uniref:RRM domain-containing protein n=1 Tax=Stylosanthes scabra TaxID=79078 RepID=A0ABU6SFU2_9FABA|nr:hypothetical protein [Stylosanthes scabra]
MGSERVLKWDWWVKQRDQRSWTKERFRELEKASFSIFVDNLPEFISKKKLFHLFSWYGMINDIYLSRKMKGGKLHLFAFIRYTTKRGVLKAIAEINYMNLNGRKLFVGKARNRRDNKILEVNTSPRNVAEIDIEFVNGREFDSAAELVLLECVESEKEVVKRDIVQDVLDEWSFPFFNRSGAFNVPMLKVHSAELVVMNHNGDEEFDGSTLLPYKILNEWNFENENKSDRSENESSEQTITWSYGKKECGENNLSLLKDVGVGSEDAMELSDPLATNESVCSSEVGIGEVVKEVSHDKQILSKRKEKEANPMERGSKLVGGERRFVQTAENGLGVSDDEDFMSGLKELNEARELKRREAKKKKKARKSRSKKLKL